MWNTDSGEVERSCVDASLKCKYFLRRYPALGSRQSAATEGRHTDAGPWAPCFMTESTETCCRENSLRRSDGSAHAVRCCRVSGLIVAAYHTPRARMEIRGSSPNRRSVLEGT